MGTVFLSYNSASCPYHSFNLPKISHDDWLKGSLSSDIIPLYSIKNYKPVSLSKVKGLVDIFLKEVEIKYNTNLANVNPNELIHQFAKSAAGLMVFIPNEISVSITSNHSLFYKCFFESYHVYLELFYDEITGKYLETAINVYKNKELQLASSNRSLQKILDELEKIISTPGSYFSDIFQEQYELSGTPNTYSYI